MHKKGKAKAFHLVRGNNSFNGYLQHSASVLRANQTGGGVFYYQISLSSIARVNRAIDKIAQEANDAADNNAG